MEKRICATIGNGAGRSRLMTRMVTMASLVERERRSRKRRPLGGRAFENRIRKGMRLQCDPTVIYGMERLESTMGR